MARQKHSTDTDVQVDPATEATATEATATEATATEATATEATATETPKAEVDLAPFESAVQDAITSSQSNSGNPAEDAIAAVVEAYRGLEGSKGKNAGKNYLRDQIMAAVNNRDIDTAKVVSILDDEIKKSPAKKASSAQPKTPVDPTAAYLEQRLVLDLARAIQEVPESLPEDFEEKFEARFTELAPQVSAYVEWLNADKESRSEEAPSADPIVIAAAKAAVGRKIKATGSAVGNGGPRYSGPRRDTLSHIKEVFDGVESGTFLKVAQIVSTKTSVYGDDRPSPGAISSRLESSTWDRDGLGIVPEKQDGVLGARKA